MIWHLAEVWSLVAATFVIGCLLGAYLYGIMAESALATAQGVVADSIGDVVDWTKVRLGMAPAWRPVHLQNSERRAAERPPDEPEQTADAYVDEDAGYPVESEMPARQEPPQRFEPPSHPPEGYRRPPPREEAPAWPASSSELTHEHFAAARPPRSAVVVPKRPPGIASPRGGVPDNLQRIKGIGRRNEAVLNTLGIYHFGQLAAWTPGEMHWISQRLAFPERIERDDWIGQATLLAMGGETGFEKAAERRRQRRSRERDFGARMTNATLVAGRPTAVVDEEMADGAAEASGDLSGEEEPAESPSKERPHEQSLPEEVSSEVGAETFLPADQASEARADSRSAAGLPTDRDAEQAASSDGDEPPPGEEPEDRP